MHLKTLIMTGFKSFPEKIRLEFNTGITAVVGPNGSGKSNISDAVRWALGEQSAKSLRGGKMEDVIFSGTENRRPLAFAEVSMIIDNTDRRMKTEYTEITVTRRMYRSGECEYRINGAACRLRDIHELFMDTGVGREGYSIIGQGNIEEILSARSDERRLLFEEAAGIVKYKSRRQEAYVKLERERQNLLRAADVIAELEQRLPPLAEQAEQARKCLELRERLKTVQINIFLSQIQSADRQTAELDEQIRVLSSQRQAEQARHENLGRLYERLMSELASAEAELNRLNEEREDLRLQAERVGAGIKVAEERSVNMQKAEDRLVLHLGKNGAQAEKKRQALEDERKKGSALNIELSVIYEQLASGQSRYESLAEGLSGKDQELERLNASLIEHVKLFLELKNKMERTESQIELLMERADAARAEGEACDGQIFEINERLSRERGAAATTAHQIEMLASRGDDLRKAAEGLNIQYEQAASDEAAVIRKLNEAESRYAALMDLERGYEGYRRSSRSVLVNKGALKGIVGAVGELFRVPAAYETAIEAALGASLNDIVVESEEDAAEAIEHLKKTHEGRATFLPVNAINPRGLGKDKDKILGEPGVVGAADTLISYEAAYGRVFSYLLGGVVVTENNAAAIRLSRKYKHNLALATLDGGQFSPGGAITGGSSGARGGLINRARELDELKKSIAEFNEQAEGHRRRAADIKARIAGSLAEADEARAKQQALLLENNTQRLKCRQMEETGAELNKKLLANAAEREKLAAQENELFEALGPLQEGYGAAERGARELRARIEDHSKTVSGERRKHDEQAGELTDLKIQAGRLEQRRQACEDGAARLETELESLTSEMAAIERELAASRETRAAIAGDVESLESDLEKIKGQSTDIAGQISDKVNLRESLRGQIAESERRQRAGAETLAGLNNEVSILNLRREQIENDTRKLYDAMWDEYQITAQAAKECKQLGLSVNQMNREERGLKNEIAAMGAVNFGAIDEYKALNERHNFLISQRDDILIAEGKLLAAIAELTELMESRFTEQFAAISKSFDSVFREMFSGGKARLVLCGDEGVLESGIEIEAQPPGKNLQNMSLLSGGERALTAAALLFGILRLKPSPFCILDEIESALDEANVTRFAEYIRRISGDTQFILITHRTGTMEAADVLYGVTMQEAGVSKLVSVRLETPVEA